MGFTVERCRLVMAQRAIIVPNRATRTLDKTHRLHPNRQSFLKRGVALQYTLAQLSSCHVNIHVTEPLPTITKASVTKWVRTRKMFLPQIVSEQQLQMEMIHVKVRKPRPTPYNEIAMRPACPPNSTLLLYNRHFSNLTAESFDRMDPV